MRTPLDVRMRAKQSTASTEVKQVMVSKIDPNDPAPILDEEDEETLAAIDEGIHDAEADRVVPIDDVRKRLPKWITNSSLRTGRRRPF